MNVIPKQEAPRKPREERRAFGKSLREVVPRSAHATWQPSAQRPDIVSLLEESNRDRLPRLIPVRFARMLRSPLDCFRGSAIVMAEDLATLPSMNYRIQICGDCHLQNFGWFATPERNVIFDVNDFDETRAAPWEWDVKRLVTSVVLVARRLNATKGRQQELAGALLQEYRQHLAAYESLSPLETWYSRVDAEALLNNTTDAEARRRAQQTIDAARKKTLDKLLPNLTEMVNTEMKFKDDPPRVCHPTDPVESLPSVSDLMRSYRTTLSDERRVLLDRYQLTDIALKVIGVGSVGLRCGIVLMVDSDQIPLVLQFKEARASVLEKFVGPSARGHHGQRIVFGQRLMQAASDLFLGWADGSDGRSYYIRQLRDMKFSVEIEKLALPEFEEYTRLCGWALARAHAKSGDASVISGYIGSSSQMDEAFAQFGMAYADQVERDFDTLTAAQKAGRIPVSENTN